jgi:hypothetical protein
MTSHPLEAEDLAAGRAAFLAGTALHGNPHDMHGVEPLTIADRQRHEAWRAGWFAECDDATVATFTVSP